MSSFFRPYDLQGVHSSEAGSEHYIFSPNSVLHVTEKGYGGLVSLAEWYRESVLWTALQEISFFRDFRLRKAFTWYSHISCLSHCSHECFVQIFFYLHTLPAWLFLCCQVASKCAQDIFSAQV